MEGALAGSRPSPLRSAVTDKGRRQSKMKKRANVETKKKRPAHPRAHISWGLKSRDIDFPYDSVRECVPPSGITSVSVCV